MTPLWPLLASLAALSVAAAPLPLRNPDGSCVMFPPGSPLHTDVSSWPIYSKSGAVTATIGNYTSFHADFAGGYLQDGQNIYYGIPLNTLDSRTRTFPAGGQIIFNGWPGESDPGPYPFPLFARIEGAYPGCPPSLCPGDRHVLVRDNATCTLYEGYACTAPASMAARWKCSNGARFNLSSTAMPQRPLGWTSEDAAGLPIWAGLITLHDVFVRRSIDHAIRFTAPSEVAAYAPPASHLIDVDHTADSPWMGARARLRASFDCAKAMATPAARVICRAMKRTGLVLADRGSAWYLTGEASGEWEARLGPTFDQFLSDIKAIKGADIEVVVAPPALGGFCLCTSENCGCKRV